MQIKVGQIYKVKKGHEKMCWSYGTCDNARYIKITDDNEDCLRYEILDENKEIIDCCNCFEPTDLEEVNKYKVGDILVDDENDECKVLEVGETSFLLSYDSDFNKASNWFTFQEIENKGYKLKDQEEVKPEEMTLSEVCKELGRTVKIVK